MGDRMGVAGPMTCVELVAALTVELERDPVDADWALRLVGMTVDGLRDIAHQGDTASWGLFAAAPGLERLPVTWATLVAGVIGHHARIWTGDAPPWCDIAPLPTPWAPWRPGRVPRRPIKGLRDLNVLLDASWFETV
ncbi:hypothetical protein [Actinotalea sp. C106]|uniref:hypothetical protein n=1 Tax=Actinotalea sp. C106 TaxID=2908644 RepID=UPI0020288B9B|nr:hypothetical protein [Actinotalea sp. C106]